MPRSADGGLTRRAFVGALSVPLAAASACRGVAGGRGVPARSSVALLPASSYAADFADIVARGLTTLGVDVRGRRVVLKPNMVEYEAGSAINTDPRVVAGAIVALRRGGAASVVVAEGPGHRRDTEYLVTSTGLAELLRDDRVAFVDLNEDDVREVPLKTGYTGLTSVTLPVTVLDADLLVSMPKLKTHHWAGVTASMKNLFGTLPGAVYGWPKNVLHLRGIHNSILDLASTLRPGLAILDGVIGMEGDGPIMGRPRSVGVIAMSTDPVALDATAARIIGLDPRRLPYLAEAGRYLGQIDPDRIDQRGEPVARYASAFDVVDAFKPARIAGAAGEVGPSLQER